MRALLQSGGGKDSILAFHKVLGESPNIESVGMLVTVTEDFNRVSMHGIREELIESQAASLGLKIFKSYIPVKASNEIYIERTLDTLKEIINKYGVKTVVFGDIFLEDIRSFRENMLKELKLQPIFPLWKIDTLKLADEFISLGFHAITVVVDLEKLSDEFLCREFNRDFLDSLPESVDPMGENGEFHTFVYDGPIFKKQVKFRTGKFHTSGRFKFCDLISE